MSASDDDESLPCRHLQVTDRLCLGLFVLQAGVLGYFVGWPITRYLWRVVPVILGW